MNEHAIAPIVAQEAIWLVYFMPSIAVYDLIVTKESLKDDTVSVISFETALSHNFRQLLWIFGLFLSFNVVLIRCVDVLFI